jgi:hypothetical protein
MVNCLNVKKYILSIVSENFAVSVSVSDTKSKSRDLDRLVSIIYILYFDSIPIARSLRSLRSSIAPQLVRSACDRGS